MFERDLQRRLERIFGLSKTTFLAPDHQTPEQDTLFVTVIEARPRMQGNMPFATARVRGLLTVFSQAMLRETPKEDPEAEVDASAVRLPFGYFGKRIAGAERLDVDPFFFGAELDVTNSPARTMNIHERQVEFTFLYKAQYDPDRGELTSIGITTNLEATP